MQGPIHIDQAPFEAGLRAAMAMGTPPAPTDRAVFVFADTTTNTAPADAENVPFDPAATPTVTPGRRISGVLCAIEYLDAQGQLVDLGVLAPTQIRITLIDAEYQQVRGFDYVEMSGDKYFYRRTAPAVGLDASQFWTVYCRAEDDT